MISEAFTQSGRLKTGKHVNVRHLCSRIDTTRVLRGNADNLKRIGACNGMHSDAGTSAEQD